MNWPTAILRSIVVIGFAVVITSPLWALLIYFRS